MLQSIFSFLVPTLNHFREPLVKHLLVVSHVLELSLNLLFGCVFIIFIITWTVCCVWHFTENITFSFTLYILTEGKRKFLHVNQVLVAPALWFHSAIQPSSQTDSPQWLLQRVFRLLHCASSFAVCLAPVHYYTAKVFGKYKRTLRPWRYCNRFFLEVIY